MALGALPGGTTNVVALALGLPADPVEAARRLATAEPRPFDLGRAGDDDFLMQLSGGLDARVMASVDPRLKRRLGKGAVAWAGVREWWRYRFPAFALEIDGRADRGDRLRRRQPRRVRRPLPDRAGRAAATTAGSTCCSSTAGAGATRSASRSTSPAAATWRAPTSRCCPSSGCACRARPLVLQYDGDPFEAAPPLEVALAPERLLLLAPARPLTAPHPRGQSARRRAAIPSAPKAMESTLRQRPLDPIFRPRSVAVVGASRSRDSIGWLIVHNLLSAQFAGAIFPVNPKADAVHSLKCYPSLAAIPDPVDLADHHGAARARRGRRRGGARPRACAAWW